MEEGQHGRGRRADGDAAPADGEHAGHARRRRAGQRPRPAGDARSGKTRCAISRACRTTPSAICRRASSQGQQARARATTARQGEGQQGDSEAQPGRPPARPARPAGRAGRRGPARATARNRARPGRKALDDCRPRHGRGRTRAARRRSARRAGPSGRGDGSHARGHAQFRRGAGRGTARRKATRARAKPSVAPTPTARAIRWAANWATPGASGRTATCCRAQDVYRRAQDLLDEIRRRSGDQTRPRSERDYLKRLLDLF